MTRRLFTKLIPIMVFALILSLGFGILSVEAMAKPSPSLAKNLKIDTVDGQKYCSQIHKIIVAVVIYRNAVNGKQVLAFSNLDKYKAFQQKHLAQHKRKSSPSKSFFYEHASFDQRGLGDWISLKVGKSSYFVGNNWNDRISSVDVYPSSWVTLYQHWHYEGYYLTLINNSNKTYWFQNLTNYRMPNGTNWNDQTSSITTGWK